MLVALLCVHPDARWSPPLRESWAFPVFVLQNCVIVFYLIEHTMRSPTSDKNPKGKHLISGSDRGILTPRAHMGLLAGVTVWFCVSWQLSQFVLTTQATVFGLLYVMGYVLCSPPVCAPRVSGPNCQCVCFCVVPCGLSVGWTAHAQRCWSVTCAVCPG